MAQCKIVKRNCQYDLKSQSYLELLFQVLQRVRKVYIRIEHSLPTRTRLRLVRQGPVESNFKKTLDSIIAALSTITGVKSVEVTKLTGSILIAHQAERKFLSRAALVVQQCMDCDSPEPVTRTEIKINSKRQKTPGRLARFLLGAGPYVAATLLCMTTLPLALELVLNFLLIRFPNSISVLFMAMLSALIHQPAALELLTGCFAL